MHRRYYFVLLFHSSFEQQTNKQTMKLNFKRRRFMHVIWLTTVSNRLCVRMREWRKEEKKRRLDDDTIRFSAISSYTPNTNNNNILSEKRAQIRWLWQNVVKKKTPWTEISRKSTKKINNNDVKYFPNTQHSMSTVQSG